MLFAVGLPSNVWASCLMISGTTLSALMSAHWSIILSICAILFLKRNATAFLLTAIADVCRRHETIFKKNILETIRARDLKICKNRDSLDKPVASIVGLICNIEFKRLSLKEESYCHLDVGSLTNVWFSCLFSPTGSMRWRSVLIRRRNICFRILKLFTGSSYDTFVTRCEVTYASRISYFCVGILSYGIPRPHCPLMTHLWEFSGHILSGF